jgi:DNA invertase Pin-like site-specific DNA recombinase
MIKVTPQLIQDAEATGERIRDKIAASKVKGMWMGGPLSLGYRFGHRHS